MRFNGGRRPVRIRLFSLVINKRFRNVYDTMKLLDVWCGFSRREYICVERGHHRTEVLKKYGFELKWNF